MPAAAMFLCVTLEPDMLQVLCFIRLFIAQQLRDMFVSQNRGCMMHAGVIVRVGEPSPSDPAAGVLSILSELAPFALSDVRSTAALELQVCQQGSSYNHFPLLSHARQMLRCERIIICKYLQILCA